MSGSTLRPSQKFTDETGQEWTLSFTCADLWRVHDSTGVDLGTFVSVTTGLSSLPSAVRVLYAAVEPQAEAAGVSPEEFARGLAGESLGRAIAALWGAIADFSPSSTMAQVIRRMLDANDRAEHQGNQAIQDLTDEEFDQMLREDLFGMTSGSVPESSASSPQTGHTGSSE